MQLSSDIKMIRRPAFKTLNLIEIDAGALIHNLHLYKKFRPDISICPVLKSNAYGHGLTLIGKILDPLGLDFFIVDSLYEAFQLREKKIKSPVLVLGDTIKENFYKVLPFHFSVFNERTLHIHAKFGHYIHLEIDTGMNRLGVNIEELPYIIKIAKNTDAKIVGIFTHFLSAEEENKYRLNQQEDIFREAIKMLRKAGFKPKWIHAANSAGGIQSDMQEVNMMRLGISLYGVNPLQSQRERLKDLRLVAQVRSKVIEIRKIKKGESVGYGSASFIAKKEMEIAVIPFGYYEGLPRSLSNKGIVEIKGINCPIIGMICMNHAMIDVSERDISVGDLAFIYSNRKTSEASFEAQSIKAGTIPYELMVRLSESIRRVEKE